MTDVSQLLFPLAGIESNQPRITVFDALRYVIAYLKGAAISWGQSAAEISIEDIPYEYRSEVAKAPRGTFEDASSEDDDNQNNAGEREMRKIWDL